MFRASKIADVTNEFQNKYGEFDNNKNENFYNAIEKILSN